MDNGRYQHGYGQPQSFREGRLIFGSRDARAIFGPDDAPRDDVEHVGSCQQQAGNQHAEQNLADVRIGGGADDNRKHRGRDDGAERTAGADGS
jgi:hypothetical protein